MRNFFFVFAVLAYLGLLFAFYRRCESWSELLWGIVVICPLVKGTLFALPALRDFCIQSYAMAPADGKLLVSESMYSMNK
ncbi:hypothetical protein ACP70R_038583 [Stipagrostis hirtigluma subsp. patula]